MIHSFKQTFMTYNPDEFVPVYREGNLDKKIFFGYKAKGIATKVINVVDEVFTRPL